MYFDSKLSETFLKNTGSCMKTKLPGCDERKCGDASPTPNSQIADNALVFSLKF
jgi:hypothetical protein